LIVNWRENEERLGIEIDNRTMAYVASGTETFQKMLGVGLAVGSSDRLEHFSILNSLLWPRGSSVRSNALRWFSPFAAPVLTERLLLRRFVSAAGIVVGIDEEGWSERFQLLLRSNGQAAVSSPNDSIVELAEAVSQLLATPLDLKFLEVFPKVAGVERNNGRVEVRFEVLELEQ
jgi:ATP-dependent Lhr-like helicase